MQGLHSCGYGAVERAALRNSSCRRQQIRFTSVIRNAKRKKGGKQEQGPAPSRGMESIKTGRPTKEGAAYAEETRNIILTASKITKAAPSGKSILKDVSLSMYLGAKIGVLGLNGSGKSTFMKIMAGLEKDFTGTVQLKDGIKVSFLEQEPKLEDGKSVEENIRPALQHMQAMLNEFEEVSMKMGSGTEQEIDTLMKRMEVLQTAIDAAEGWELERQLERAADALRCPPYEAPVEQLSGGERRRVALCRVLLEQPDILFLDEPTNHLDAASVAWLEKTLAIFKGTVVAVTHDRYFLDNVAGWILELDQGKGLPFEGNYSQWLEAKAKRMEQQGRQASAAQKEINAELEWAKKQAKGQQKKGKARMRRLDELQAQAAENSRQQQLLESITIPVGPRLGNVVIEAKHLTKAFGERLLLNDATFSVPPGSIVGIVGSNGAGKSTLFRMIVGQQQPDGGELVVGETVVPMYVDQSRGLLESEQSVFEAIGDGEEEVELGGRKVNTRAYCSWFNFRGADQQKSVGVLSGGERNRLHLAKVLKKSGNLLLLDEPTNDLDVETLRALEGAINTFVGTAMVISHDRWFLERIATHILAFEGDSKVVWFEGGYSEYEEDWRKRNGNVDPSRIKYRKMATV